MSPAVEGRAGAAAAREERLGELEPRAPCSADGAILGTQEVDGDGPGEPCTGLRMRNVTLESAGAAAKAYTCMNAHGVADSCQPEPCLTP